MAEGAPVGAPPAPAGGDRLDPARARAVLLILASVALMVTYVETMVVPALVRFQIFFDHPPISTVAWILSAYLLVGVATTPIFGKLGDIYGKKRILVLVLAVYAIAVTFAGFTPQIGAAFGVSRLNQIYILIAVRGVQGIGMAMFPLAFALIGEEFPPREVAGAQGVISAMFAAGAAIGLFGGAYLTQTQGWQFTYHTVIPFAFLILGLTIYRLRESNVRLRRPLDIPGSIFLGGALATFLVALSEGPTWGWGNWSGWTVASVPLGTPVWFLFALVLAIGFLLWEPRSPSPIVDFNRLKQRNIAISNLVAVIAGACMFLLFVANTILLQLPAVGLDQTVLTTGLVSLPTAISMMIFGPIIGRAVSRYGPKPAMIAGSVSMAGGGFFLSYFNRTILEFVVGGIPLMVGVIATFIAMTNVIVLSSRREETGIQTGMNATFRTLGQSLGPVVATTLLSAFTGTFVVAVVHPAPGLAVPITAQLPRLVAFQYVYLTAAILGILSAIASSFLINYRFAADGTRIDAPRGTVVAPERGAPTAPPVAD
jgi:MFS family permease